MVLHQTLKACTLLTDTDLPMPLLFEGAGGEQGGDKDREDDEGEQEDKKLVNFYFPGQTLFV